MRPVNRRTLVNGLCLVPLAPTIARAQVVGKVYRVGVLTPNPASPVPGLFIAALRERGWVIGRNLAVEIHETKGDPERAEALARDLARQPVDLIATNVTATAMAARRATSVIPIVMLTSGFPVDSLRAACRSGRLLSSGRGASYTEKSSNRIGTWRAQAALSGGSRRWSKGSTR